MSPVQCSSHAGRAAAAPTNRTTILLLTIGVYTQAVYRLEQRQSESRHLSTPRSHALLVEARDQMNALQVHDAERDDDLVALNDGGGESERPCEAKKHARRRSLRAAFPPPRARARHGGAPLPSILSRWNRPLYCAPFAK